MSGDELDPAVMEGALLFGRYAFPPNRLGYCGPDDHQAIFEHTVTQQGNAGLLDLERRFEGAYPYLRLIALGVQSASPFDRRVVEAYWLGNDLLERVGESPFYASLKERFQGRMDSHSFGWLVSKLEHGARPHHNFHVFDVYTKAGLMRDRKADISLETMDNCRISWGTVEALDGADLVVKRQPLILADGKLTLGAAQPMRVQRQIEGRGFAEDVHPGDIIATHWNWACERLTPQKLAWLQVNTRRALALANETL